MTPPLNVALTGTSKVPAGPDQVTELPSPVPLMVAKYSPLPTITELGETEVMVPALRLTAARNTNTVERMRIRIRFCLHPICAAPGIGWGAFAGTDFSDAVT